MLSSIIKAPISWLYGLGVAIRHKLFDMKIFRTEEFDIPIVCVGNITVGGTGKTPHVEMLIDLLYKQFNIGIISRGYKRKTKGFYLADESSSAKIVGDEPMQIKMKYPWLPVAVCENRVEGIKKLREKHPEVDLIIMDDGFQHRYVEPWVTVLLVDYNNPVYQDRLLPWGRLRDLKSRLSKASIVVVTKCPDNILPINMRMVSNNLELYPFQSLFFTQMISLPPVPVFPMNDIVSLTSGQDVVVMSSIANNENFINETAKNFNTVDVLEFPDHHAYMVKDINQMRKALAKGNTDTVIFTTEKDAAKLCKSNKIPDDIKRRLFYIPIYVDFVPDYRKNSQEEFLLNLLPYVRQNQKYGGLNPYSSK